VKEHLPSTQRPWVKIPAPKKKKKNVAGLELNSGLSDLKRFLCVCFKGCVPELLDVKHSGFGAFHPLQMALPNSWPWEGGAEKGLLPQRC
jgi:hypothetical protein